MFWFLFSLTLLDASVFWLVVFLLFFCDWPKGSLEVHGGKRFED
jgi:hypothetical protein